MGVALESDAVASNKVTARKRRLGGSARITLDRYPRVTFAVDCKLDRVVNLSPHWVPKGLAEIRETCLDEDVTASVQMGELLKMRGVQGLIFPSAVGLGKNLIVYLDNCSPTSLQLGNGAELLAVVKKLVKRVIA